MLTKKQSAVIAKLATQKVLKGLKPTRYVCLIASLVVAIVVTLNSCAPDNNTMVGKAWHNLNAHFNGYFLGKEKMKEAENAITIAQKDNYNRILEVYPPLTVALEASIQPMLQEAIKKASLPIQRHKLSKWVDDCYLVVGKARYYKRDEYDFAVQTFKYINSKTTDVNMRHTALIWLFRTYTKGEEYNNAVVASDYLKKQKLKPYNLKDFYVAMANYHQKQKENKLVADYLSLAIKYMIFPSDQKARYHYIIGQIRQREGKDSIAYVNFRKCINNNPVYEMGFQAKLALGQVTALSNTKDVKRVQRYFRNLLKDDKNIDLKDRVYYEMGRFEAKRQDYDKAVVDFKLSLKQKSINPTQKGYTYWRVAEINYEKYKDYPTAKLYYDSTVAALDTADENFKSIVKRQKVLVDFVKEYQIVQREDSLQKIAAMDSAKRNALVDSWLARDEAKKNLADKVAKKAARRDALVKAGGGSVATNFDGKSGLGFDAGGSSASGSTWYFYNPTAMSAGQSAFLKKWGRRPLEDNWRRSTKEKVLGEDSATVATTDGKPKLPSSKGTTDSTSKDGTKDGGQDATANEGSKIPKKGKDGIQLLASEANAAKRAIYLKDVPFGKTALDASNEKLKPALYALGKIYELRLDEHVNAEAIFTRIVDTHYDYEKTPEAMYFLYLINLKKGAEGTAKAESWKQRLFKEFPNSTFARLIKNPRYLVEQKAANDAVSVQYKQAYALYETGNFVEAQVLIQNLIKTYPDNDHLDRLTLLDALIVGRTVDFNTYKKQLTDFQTKFPKSKLVPTVRDFVTTGESFIKKNPKLVAKTDSTSKPDSLKSPYTTPGADDVHFFMAVVRQQTINEEEVKGRLSYYNKKFFPNDVFTTNTLSLADSVGKHYLVTVKEFKTRLAAMSYLKKQKDEKGIWRRFYAEEPVQLFVISQANYPIFYKLKDINQYEAFHTKAYDLGVIE